MSAESIFSAFLRALGVRHTRSYSDSRFAGMPFQSLFGFSRLLTEYGVPNDGLYFEDRRHPGELPCPCLVQYRGVFVILESAGRNSVEYEQDGVPKTLALSDFEAGWSGVALVAYPGADSCEPDYGRHHFMEVAEAAKCWLLALCVAAVVLWAYFGHEMWRSWSRTALLALDCAGVYISYLLTLKSARISSSAADRVCGVLEQGGCDHVLEQKASKFFGLFGWSEVGLSYFSVSLAVSLIWPDMMPELALVNLCCVPFSFWSVWYQKTRAKAWCTMCLIVQALLWLCFGCYLCGGWYEGILPLRWSLLPLAAAYMGMMLGFNRLVTAFEKRRNRK